MNNIIYRRAGKEDVSILVDNRIKFALELSGPKEEEIINTLRSNMTNYFLKATENNSCISFIAECDGEVAGIGSIHLREVPGNFKNLSGKWGYIMNMYTIPKYRRKGICTGILNALVDAGKKLGIMAFELHATEDGEHVYKLNGFNKHNEPTYRRFLEISRQS